MIKLVLENINVDIEKQWVVIYGKNLLNLNKLLDVLCGKTKIVNGIYCFEGRNTADFTAREMSYFRKSQAININDNHFLLEEYSVGKNLQMQLKYSGIYPTKIKRIIDRTLSEMEITELKDKLVSELTTIQRLQVMLAKAMVVEPKLICGLAPFVYLNEDEIRAFIQLVRKIIDGGTRVIMVTENRSELQYGDGKIIIDNNII